MDPAASQGAAEPINLDDLPIDDRSAVDWRIELRRVLCHKDKACAYLQPPMVVPTSIGIRRSRIYIVMDPGEGERWIPLPPPPPRWEFRRVSAVAPPPAAASPSGGAPPPNPVEAMQVDLDSASQWTPVSPWTGSMDSLEVSETSGSMETSDSGGAASQAALAEAMQIDSGGAASQPRNVRQRRH